MKLRPFYYRLGEYSLATMCEREGEVYHVFRRPLTSGWCMTFMEMQIYLKNGAMATASFDRFRDWGLDTLMHDDAFVKEIFPPDQDIGDVDLFAYDTEVE